MSVLRKVYAHVHKVEKKIEFSLDNSRARLKGSKSAQRLSKLPRYTHIKLLNGLFVCEVFSLFRFR